MCTAFASNGYFGRTLDFEESFDVGSIIIPRRAEIEFLHLGKREEHLAFVGAGLVSNGFPLVFDGVNENGLFVAALNFPKSAVYLKSSGARYDIASFELVALVLSVCRTAKEGAELLKKCRITDEAFSEELPPSPLHWFVADGCCCYTVEQTEEGLRIHENSLGVLTNEPPFPYQLEHLSNFSGLSARAPKDGFVERLGISASSRGVGTVGLPGDFTSQSRFVRASYVVHNTEAESEEEKCVARHFKMAASVSVPRGCVVTHDGKSVCTVYTSCASKAGYWYSKYDSIDIKSIKFSDIDINVNLPIFTEL